MRSKQTANAKRNITQLKKAIVLTRQRIHSFPPHLLKPFLASLRCVHDRAEPHARRVIALPEEGNYGAHERLYAVRVQLQAILQAAWGEGVERRQSLVTEKLFDGGNCARRVVDCELHGHQSQALEVGDGATYWDGFKRGCAEAVAEDWGFFCAFLACLVDYVGRWCWVDQNGTCSLMGNCENQNDEGEGEGEGNVLHFILLLFFSLGEVRDGSYVDVYTMSTP